MERHELDVVSLVVGTLFLALGIAVVFGGFDAFTTGRSWILPGVLIGLGTLIAAVALNRELRGRRPETPDADVAPETTSEILDEERGAPDEDSDRQD